jgi:hypothetical protein
MSEVTSDDRFQRTLPLFNSQDRDIIQRLLHHAVEDLRYDHPDRKISRDLYHEVQEGEAIRLLVGSTLEDETLVITPSEHDSDAGQILERFVKEISSKPGEWEKISSELCDWRQRQEISDTVQIAFEYLH